MVIINCQIMQSSSGSGSEDEFHSHPEQDFPDPDGWFHTKASYNIPFEDFFLNENEQREICSQEPQEAIETASSRREKKMENQNLEMDVPAASPIFEQSPERPLQKLPMDEFQLSGYSSSGNNSYEEIISLLNPSDLNLINYNKELIKKTKTKKIKGKNRYPDIFLPRFKWKIKRFLEKQNPGKKIKMKDLKNLPGLLEYSMKNMIKLLESENLMSTGVPANIVAEEYTSSNEILLDVIFPLETRSGQLRKAKIQKESTNDFNRFFTSYEIISKLIGCSQIQNSTLNFQNCRYYHLVTNTEYTQFQPNQ